jgi:hypothetical protein
MNLEFWPTLMVRKKILIILIIVCSMILSFIVINDVISFHSIFLGESGMGKVSSKTSKNYTEERIWCRFELIFCLKS